MPNGKGLADFMDSISERGILIQQLPLIPSLSDARSKLRWPDLTVRQALFRGRVPALIFYTRGSVPPPFDKRKGVIDLLFHTWDDVKVKELLSSFLSGDSAAVPKPLLQLMSGISCRGPGQEHMDSISHDACVGKHCMRCSAEPDDPRGSADSA